MEKSISSSKTEKSIGLKRKRLMRRLVNALEKNRDNNRKIIPMLKIRLQ